MTNDKPEPTQDAGQVPWAWQNDVRMHSRFFYRPIPGTNGKHELLMPHNAADRLTALEAENAALRRERDEMKHAATVATEEMHRFWGRAREAEAELETLRAKAALCAELLDELPPCDIDRSWCLTHQANGCQVDVIRARYDALTTEASPAVVEEPQ